jgi:hypothetical protein
LIRQALQISGDGRAIGAKKPRKPDAAWILAQPLVDFLTPAFRSIARHGIRISRNRIIDAARHICGRLPVDEAEHQQNAKREGAGDDERPAECRRPDEFRQAHGG